MQTHYTKKTCYLSVLMYVNRKAVIQEKFDGLNQGLNPQLLVLLMDPQPRRLRVNPIATEQDC